MPPAHRHGDGRICRATTTVVNQNSVFVNGVLWAVMGDTNTDGNGQLFASPDSSVKIHNIPVVTHSPTGADEDDRCPLESGDHCNPYTSAGSSNVSAYG